MIHGTCQFTIDQFNWNKHTELFSQEASSLELEPGEFPRWIRVINPKTNQMERFTFYQVVHNNEEVGGIEYKSRKRRLTMMIWND